MCKKGVVPTCAHTSLERSLRNFVRKTMISCPRCTGRPSTQTFFRDGVYSSVGHALVYTCAKNGIVPTCAHTSLERSLRNFVRKIMISCPRCTGRRSTQTFFRDGVYSSVGHALVYTCAKNGVVLTCAHTSLERSLRNFVRKTMISCPRCTGRPSTQTFFRDGVYSSVGHALVYTCAKKVSFRHVHIRHWNGVCGISSEKP
jgi:transposase-like protein